MFLLHTQFGLNIETGRFFHIEQKKYLNNDRPNHQERVISNTNGRICMKYLVDNHSPHVPHASVLPTFNLQPEFSL